MGTLQIEQLKLGTLKPYEKNSNKHSDWQIKKIADSIKEFGFTNPILVAEGNLIVAGHGRALAARQAGLETVPCIRLAMSPEMARAYIIADNQLARLAEWDHELLASEIIELKDLDINIDVLGFDDKELAKIRQLVPEANWWPQEGADDDDDETGVKGSLAAKFGVPPFSVLNAREGWWQDRKRAWVALGIKSELGRGDNIDAAPGGSPRPLLGNESRRHNAAPGGSPRPLDRAKASKFGKCMEKGIGESCGRDEMNATSIFDPVLCELAYRWFSPKDGLVLDPFAGGSVRGIVASKLGRQYVGLDLRAEQVEANKVQAASICQELEPVWHVADSRNIATVGEGVQADFVFSCPPYADLEVYSDDPADLSTMDYAEFKQAYREIIAASCSLLKEDRFACFVVGDVRDDNGHYYNFVGDTVEAFRASGLEYYNEAILLTAIGSLPVRAGKVFRSARKLGKTHQNVLVFVKGDAKRATEACGDCDFGELTTEDIAAKYGELL